MRVMVTGATGFIGGAVARALRARGDDVVGLVRTPSRATALHQLGVSLVEGDLDDLPALRTSMHGADAVVHCAAVYRVGIRARDVEPMRRANVDGTANVLDAAAAEGIKRIVYVSTINVFGNTRGRVVDETYTRDLTLGYLSAYDQTKYAAHVLVQRRAATGTPVVTAQPGAVYGPGDHSELGDQIDKARRGKLPAISFGDLGVVMCHVDDIAAGIILALDRGAIGRSYVLGGEVTTLGEVIRQTATLADVRPPRASVPAWAVKASRPIAPLVTRAMGLSPNLRELIRVSDGVTYWATDLRAREELGYAPRLLRDGLQQLVEAAG